MGMIKFYNALESGEVKNYCYSYDPFYERWTAYLMGEGAEQCIASYDFNSKDEIETLYQSYGIKYYFAI